MNRNFRNTLTLSLILGVNAIAFANPPVPSPAEQKQIEELRTQVQDLDEARTEFLQAIDELNSLGKFERPSLSSGAAGDKDPMEYWHLKGPQEEGKYEGINATNVSSIINSTDKQVIVAVIDGGTNTDHEAIKDYALHNSAEENGKEGVDDDGDGYVDNYLGWDFVGANVTADTMELTRQYVRCQSKAIASSEYCKTINKDYKFEYKKLSKALATVKAKAARLAVLQSKFKATLPTGTEEEIAKKEAEYYGKDAKLGKFLKKSGLPWNAIAGMVEYYDLKVNTYLNPNQNIEKQTANYTPGKIGYGSNNAIGPDPSHGTHVAGIVVKVFETALGGKDNALPYLRILPIRVVPDGDERDVDVANGIRYAVDHGANVIQMSFGKSYSALEGKQLVDAAIKYGQDKGVIFVHAAGNDGHRNISTNNYPNAIQLNQTTFANWIEVGNSAASATFDRTKRISIANRSSNYGQLVDIFAPGTKIYAAYSEKKEDVAVYKFLQGTSMSAPVISGIVAVLIHQNPKATPAEIKAALLKGARTNHSGDDALFYEYITEAAIIKKLEDRKQGTEVVINVMPFGQASKTGGLADVYSAVTNLGNP